MNFYNGFMNTIRAINTYQVGEIVAYFICVGTALGLIVGIVLYAEWRLEKWWKTRNKGEYVLKQVIYKKEEE